MHGVVCCSLMFEYHLVALLMNGSFAIWEFLLHSENFSRLSCNGIDLLHIKLVIKVFPYVLSLIFIYLIVAGLYLMLGAFLSIIFIFYFAFRGKLDRALKIRNVKT